ncbi:MAG: hypothetical protein Q9210_003724, partial [Variospora velana]
MEHRRRRSSTAEIPFQQLLKNNKLAIIENPLRRIPENRLSAYIESFHEDHNLANVVDLATIIRGARLARDEEAFMSEEVAEKRLTKIEMSALEREKHTSIWTESRELKIILLTCCVASIAQGWVSEPLSLSARCEEYEASAGQILTSWQTGTALGIAISATIPFIVRPWRFQIFSSFIPALPLLFLVFVGSESPRWLIKKQRYCKAYDVLLRLRENPLLAARDLVFIWAQLQVETTLFTRTTEDVIDLENRILHLDERVYLREIGLLGYARRITQLFTIPRARRATLASFLVMIAQQMAGVNVFAFLASTLFGYSGDDQHRGIPNQASLLLYLGFGIANFL